MAVYWDYFQDAGTSATGGGRYYKTWSTTATSSTTSQTYTTYQPQRIERYVLTGFDGWSDEAKAVLTRLINDETNTGFKVEMWMLGAQITDPSIMIRDLDWFMFRLRQVATSADYEKIAGHVTQVRAEIAQAIEAGTGETPKSGSTAKRRKRGR